MIVPIYEYGEREFLIADTLRTVSSLSDLDTATAQWQTSSRTSFRPGGAFPGFNNIFIERDEVVEELPGRCYVHHLQGRGVLNNLTPVKIIRPTVKRTSEGWDEGRCEILSKNRNYVAIGAGMSGFSNLKCVEVEDSPEILEGGWYRLRPIYRGFASGTSRVIKEDPVANDEGWDELHVELLSTNDNAISLGGQRSGYSNLYCSHVIPQKMTWGNFYRITATFKGLLSSKPYKRRITVNDEVVSPSRPFINGLSGGWSTPQKGTFSLPRIVVVDNYVSTSAPPTGDIPGTSTPNDAPDIHSEIPFSGMEVTYNWPSGWVLKGIEGEQIPGKSLWLTTLTREYVWQKKPG